MTEYLILSAFAFWFAELSSIPQMVLHWINFLSWMIGGSHNGLTRLKPFDCVKCLGFWIGLIYTYKLTDNLMWSIISGGVYSLTAMTMNYVYKLIKGTNL